MESADDMVVIIVGDGDEQNGSNGIPPPFEIKQETPQEGQVDLKVEELLRLALKHGEYLACDTHENGAIKMELEKFDSENGAIVIRVEKSDSQENGEMGNEVERFDSYDSFAFEDDEYHNEDMESPNNDDHDEDTVLSDSENKRYNPRRQIFLKSFVEELKNKYPKLRSNRIALINTLVENMKSVKMPCPPRDYFIMNGIMFECVKCGVLTDRQPAAWRHYQEKHGTRYLVCYACGVDFRSTTNLYKHEKICSAADAMIVLQARATFLGRKGRGRPLIQIVKKEIKKSTETKKSFPCPECPAVFNSKYSLQSHEYLHRGERPYRCHVCPRAYTSYSALLRHVQMHTGVQYICEHCGRPFKVKAALIVHMDTHLPQRRFACDLCDRRYVQKAALKRHINRVHLNLPPPCACQLCPKRYPRMSVLKQHMKKAHGLSIMTRKMFFKALPTLTDMQLQQLRNTVLTTGVVVKEEDVTEQRILRIVPDT